jgi:two-component system, NarL family, response regulator YdfI
VIRVLIWARSPFMQAGLEAAVGADPRFETLAKPGRSADLAAAVRTLRPDVVLLDAPETDIRRVLTETQLLRAGPALVALTGITERGDLLRLLRSGVRAILPGDSAAAEIGDALQAASSGLAVIAPEFLDVLLPSTEGTDSEPSMLQEPLTSRESEVLALLAEGAGNREIAAKLSVSEHTAKFHVSSILSKLGAATRTEAVTRGYRLGLILI